MKRGRTQFSRFITGFMFMLMLWLCLTPLAMTETSGGSIGGLVWEDADVNGLRTAGEKRLPDLTVRLLNQKDGTAVGAVTTDKSGAYRFDSVTSGYYTVVMDAPDWALTLKNAVGGANCNSDFGRGTGVIAANVRMQRNAAITHLDAGLFTPTADTTTAAVGGYVWDDKNHNGVWEAGEPAKPGVMLYGVTDGGQTARTTSWWDGYYEFDFAALSGKLGDATLSISLPGSYTLTRYQAEGSKNSDFYVTKRKTAAITLPPNASLLDVDAGLYYRKPIVTSPPAPVVTTSPPPLPPPPPPPPGPQDPPVG